jgi:hypothetical protein
MKDGNDVDEWMNARVAVQENVPRLEVAVDDALHVEVGHRV